MGLITSLLGGLGGGWLAALVTLVVGAAGMLFLKTKADKTKLTADADVAKANAEKADAQKEAAVAGTVVARTQEVAAQANADAAQTGVTAAQERTNVDNDFASKPADDPASGANWLRDNGFVLPSDPADKPAPTAGAGDPDSHKNG